MINMWYLLNPALQLHEKKLFLHSWSIQSISRKYFMFNLALLWNTHRNSEIFTSHLLQGQVFYYCGLKYGTIQVYSFLHIHDIYGIFS